MSDTIAVIQPVAVFAMTADGTSGMKHALTLYGDQPYGRVATNQGRKGLSLVADTLPDLLRTVASYMEQEGMTTLDELSSVAVKDLADGGDA